MSRLPRLQKCSVVGPTGRLEGRVEWPDTEVRGLAVVGHPHPQHGGTMHNNVVVHVGRALVEQGFIVARFNFRGVGASEGEYAGGAGENADYLSVVEWLRDQHRQVELLLAAGFSFGAIRALHCAAQGKASCYLGIAPPLAREDHGEAPVAGVPAALVIAGDDELVPRLSAAQRRHWFPDLRYEAVVAGAGHLFQGRLGELRAAVARGVGEAAEAAGRMRRVAVVSARPAS